MSDPRSHPYFLERTVRATVAASDREGARIELEKESRRASAREHRGRSLAQRIRGLLSARRPHRRPTGLAAEPRPLAASQEG